MNTGEDESNSHPVNKKLVNIPLSPSSDTNDYLTGELTIPSASPKPRALIIFAHGSGSGRESPWKRQRP